MPNLKSSLESLQEKAKERTVKTQSIEYDLETIVKKITKGIIKLDPDYQRRHRWDYETSSRLIESLILNIPVPLIYLSQDFDVDTETEEARYSVIDGQQRLTAIHSFFNNKYSLEGLKVLSDLNNSFYKDLPPFLIRRLEERTIRCLRIDSTIDAQVKIDIFERLNSGSVKLEPQELRNAVFSGSYNDLCKSLSKNTDFVALLQIPQEEPDDNSKVKKMEDVELVLRFFALINGKYHNFKKTQDYAFRDFLSDELDKGNKLNENELKKLENSFTNCMKFIRENFGDLAFAKYKDENGGYKLQSKFNAAVYDALSVAIHDEIDLNKGVISQKIIDNFKKLFKDETFFDAVSNGTLDSIKLVYRIEEVKKIIRL